MIEHRKFATCAQDSSIEEQVDEHKCNTLPFKPNCARSAAASCAGCYAILIRVSYGTAAEINFWRLFTWTVGPDRAEVRHQLAQGEWSDPAKPLVLHAQCDKPLPGVHVEAWLEAQLRR